VGPRRRPEIQSRPTPECTIIKKNSKTFSPEGSRENVWGLARMFPRAPLWLSTSLYVLVIALLRWIRNTTLYHFRQCCVVVKLRSDRIDSTVLCFVMHHYSVVKLRIPVTAECSDQAIEQLRKPLVLNRSLSAVKGGHHVEQCVQLLAIGTKLQSVNQFEHSHKAPKCYNTNATARRKMDW